MKNTANDVSIKPVRNDDMRMIFEWRNTPALVKLGSSGREVSWEEHCNWFDRVLKSGNMALYIIYNEHDPAGQIRFEKEEDETYIVTIYLTDQYTGKGIGVISLKMGVEVMLRERPERRFIAFIKDNNEASIAAFSKAGFKRITNHAKTPIEHIAMFL